MPFASPLYLFIYFIFIISLLNFIIIMLWQYCQPDINANKAHGSDLNWIVEYKTGRLIIFPCAVCLILKMFISVHGWLFEKSKELGKVQDIDIYLSCLSSIYGPDLYEWGTRWPLQGLYWNTQFNTQSLMNTLMRKRLSSTVKILHKSETFAFVHLVHCSSICVCMHVCACVFVSV